MAVGKGGDMNKWHDAGIKHVLGFDINAESIMGKNGAKDRYRSLKQRTGWDSSLNYDFHVFDLSNPKNLEPIDKIIGNRKFNIISCQFAIHYFFRDTDAMDTFMQLVSKYLDDEAIFIGTTMDGNKLKEMFQENKVMQNDIYYLEYMKDKISNEPFGNTYKVNLGGENRFNEDHYFSKNASIEYLVDINVLKEIAAKHNLIFAGQHPFQEYYENQFVKSNGKRLSDNEKEFSFMNFMFFFKKSGGKK